MAHRHVAERDGRGWRSRQFGRRRWGRCRSGGHVARGFVPLAAQDPLRVDVAAWPSLAVVAPGAHVLQPGLSVNHCGDVGVVSSGGGGTDEDAPQDRGGGVLAQGRGAGRRQGPAGVLSGSGFGVVNEPRQALNERDDLRFGAGRCCERRCVAGQDGGLAARSVQGTWWA